MIWFQLPFGFDVFLALKISKNLFKMSCFICILLTYIFFSGLGSSQAEDGCGCFLFSFRAFVLVMSVSSKGSWLNLLFASFQRSTDCSETTWELEWLTVCVQSSCFIPITFIPTTFQLQLLVQPTRLALQVDRRAQKTPNCSACRPHLDKTPSVLITLRLT